MLYNPIVPSGSATHTLGLYRLRSSMLYPIHDGDMASERIIFAHYNYSYMQHSGLFLRLKYSRKSLIQSLVVRTRPSLLWFIDKGRQIY